jgi:hypothetical protein
MTLTRGGCGKLGLDPCFREFSGGVKVFDRGKKGSGIRDRIRDQRKDKR